MLETSRERVALLKAGMDGKTIEKLYIILNNFELVGCDPRKINCWEFVGCGRELGGECASESGVCMSCNFFHKVKNEEGSAFELDKSNTRTSTAQMAECI